MIMEAKICTCLVFEPQKWRKSKCKNCFQDKSRHPNATQTNSDNNIVDNGIICLSTSKTTSGEYVVEEASLESSCVEKQFEKMENTAADSSENYTEDKEDLEMNIEQKYYASVDTSRKLSYEAVGVLSRFSNKEFSSTSSLASFDALEDTTFSSYSYSGSRENLDDITSAEEHSFGEMITDVEKTISSNESEIISKLREEMENLIENQKMVEHNKDLEIQMLAKEIENLKFEMTKYSSRENIIIVKNRLELDRKHLRIEELEKQTNSLQSTVDFLLMNKYTDETQHDLLNEELKTKRKKVEGLEEETRSLEERLKLAEDLQQNDRELLEVLRNQLMKLEEDLLCSEDRNRVLDEDMKVLKTVEIELKNEKYAVQKLNKQIDLLNSKLLLKEECVKYLEDENVCLQEKNNELQCKVGNDWITIEKLSDNVNALKNDIEQCSEEIKNLCCENTELKNTQWEVILDGADVSCEMHDYIRDLEKRVSYSESKMRDLELENEAIKKDCSELSDSLAVSNAECQELEKQQLQLTEKCNKLEQVKNDQDKRFITMQRKFKKLQKEKKRFHLEKVENERKLVDIKNANSKLLMKYNDTEKRYKMIQLKLQSTEAKLTMIEGNKCYLETKVNEFERKQFTHLQRLSKLDDLIDEHFGYRTESRAKKNNFNFDSFEIKLNDIIDNKARTKSKTEVDPLKDKNFENSLMKKPRKSLLDSKTKHSGQSIPKGKIEQFNDIFNCLTSSLQKLKKQNEILETGVTSVAEFKSSLDHIQHYLSSESKNDYTTELCEVQEKGSFEGAEKSYNGINFTGDANKRKSEEGDKIITPLGDKNTLYSPYEVQFKSSLVNGFEIKPIKIEEKQENGTFAVDSNVDIMYRSNNNGFVDEGFKLQENDGDDILSNASKLMCNRGEKSFCKIDQKPFAGQDKIVSMDGDGNEIEHSETCNNYDLKNELIRIPNAVSASTTPAEHFSEFEKPTSCNNYNESILGFSESLASSITKNAITDFPIWIGHRRCGVSENESILPNCTCCSKPGQDMEKERLTTSVKCIFEVQPGKGAEFCDSKSDQVTSENEAPSSSVDTSFQPKRKRAGVAEDKEDGAKKDDDRQEEEEMFRKKMSTPHYTVAMSTVQKAFMSPEDNSTYRSNENKDPSMLESQDKAAVELSASVASHQQKWGAITLAIPTSNFDDTSNHLDSDLEQTPRYKISQEKASNNGTLPSLTVIFDKPRFKGRRPPTKEKLFSKTSFTDND